MYITGIAMSALMVANILCIFFAVGLDLLGKKFPKMTGDGSHYYVKRMTKIALEIRSRLHTV